MRGYRGAQENTRGYRGLLVEEGYYVYSWLQGYWELQVGFIYFGIIHFNFPFYL